MCLASGANAHPQTGSLSGSCSIDLNRSRVILNVLVFNSTEQSVSNLTPGELRGSGVGDASVFLQTAPRGLRELLPGKSWTFQWKGEVFGTGFLDLSAILTGDFQDGDPATTGVINCSRLTVGNPVDLTPPPTSTPAPRDTFAPNPTDTPRRGDPTRAPTNTERPTRTRMPTSTPRPTRTRMPTSTMRPTRTPLRQDTPRPTGTPVQVDTQRPTRTPIQRRPTRTPLIGRPTSTPRAARPTRTPIQGRATRTPLGGRATRTPIPQRPTRTPIQLRPTRTPRGANLVPTVPREGQTPRPAVGRLHADCSLRQTNDQIAITMVIQNTTTVDLTDVAASSLILAPEGGALFFDPTGPSPRAYRDVPAGETVTFEWGGRMNDVGAMGFSASASAVAPDGQPVVTGVVDCGIGTGPNGFFDNSTFTGSCSIKAGLNGAITLQVNNRSGEPLSEVEPFFTGNSSDGTAQINNLRGPAPRKLRRLAGAQSQKFLWEADIIGNGRVALTFRAEGTRTTGERIATQLIMCDADLSTGGLLPDLAVDEEDQRGSWVVEEQFFAPSHCAIQEGCVNGPGNRTLLKFNTTTPNNGPGDLFLGDPRNNPGMIWSDCHQHYHFEDYADYRLFDMQGNLVARGHKQAFCLVDLWRPPGSTGPREPNFPDCGFQGISAGWADIYHRDLDCQWIDVTGVPNGRYVLEVHVNPARVVRETNYANNVARTEVCIGIPRSECQ
jgi:hypothetical protein